jgi:hypothetical protein
MNIGGPVRMGKAASPPDRPELIQVLLRYLPLDGLSNEELAQWLRAAEGALRMIHKTPGSISILASDRPQ